MPRLSTSSGLVLLTMLAGCGPRTAPVRVDAQHPASPTAPEGRQVPEWLGLRPDEFDRAVGAERIEPDAAGDAKSPAHGGHAVPTHRGHAPDSTVRETESAMAPPRPSSATRDSARSAAMFVCPMHREVADTTASECPKCGMSLVRRKEKQP